MTETQIPNTSFYKDPHDPNFIKCKGEFEFTVTYLKDRLVIRLQGPSDMSDRLLKGISHEIVFINEKKSVDVLSYWASQTPTELTLLKNLLNDLVGIVEGWDALKESDFDKMDLFNIVLKFLKIHDDMHPEFPGIKNNITREFFKLSKKKNSYVLTAAEFNSDLFSNDRNQQWFDSGKPEISRERLAQDTIEELFKYKLSENEANRKAQEALKKTELELAKDWFLSRYDLNRACDIISHLYGIPQRVKDTFLYFPEALALIGFFISFFMFFFTQNQIGPFDQLATLHNIFAVVYSYILLLLYLIMLISPFVLIYLYKKKDPDIIKLLQVFLPRIVAGIIAGYLLLMSDEVWRFVGFDLGSIPAGWQGFSSGVKLLLTFFLALTVVYIYIFIEISHVKGITQVVKKSRRFFAKAYSYAIIIGMIVSDIFSLSMAEASSQLTAVSLQGFTVYIYPPVVLFLAPLALFVGIILQLLWDDKKLTDKI